MREPLPGRDFFPPRVLVHPTPAKDTTTTDAHSPGAPAEGAAPASPPDPLADPGPAGA